MTDAFNRAFEAAVARHQKGDIEGAEQDYLKLLAANPDFAPLWSNLAIIRRKKGQAKAALAMNFRAMELKADYRQIGGNLLNALRSANRGTEALGLDLVDPRGLFGTEPVNAAWRARVLMDLDRNRDALPHFKKAAQENPNDFDFRLDYAMALIKAGRIRDGLKMFEARWFGNPDQNHPAGASRWQGEDLTDKDVVFLSEQGLGDMIFMARFLPQVKEMAPKRLTAVVAGPLVRLFQGLGVFDAVVPKANFSAAGLAANGQVGLTGFDLALHLLGDDTAPPAPVAPALPEDSVQRAGEMTAPFQKRFKIGISWAAKPGTVAYERKSVALDHFLPLTEIPGVQLFSLQKDGGEELKQMGLPGIILDAASADRDLADAAGLITKLDLVISVDTAIAHLAGMMGAPLWLLTPRPAFWYWHGIGDQSPYYPSARVFRQNTPDDWSPVFAEVVNDLTIMRR